MSAVPLLDNCRFDVYIIIIYTLYLTLALLYKETKAKNTTYVYDKKYEQEL